MRQNKSALARETGIARSTLYYKPRQITKDWHTKQLIEEALHLHPGYGHKRLAIYLHLNKKRILRVMQLFGIKPYRRTVKKRFVWKPKDSVYPNLLIHEVPMEGTPFFIHPFCTFSILSTLVCDKFSWCHGEF
jgi:hypothetical protein